MSPGKKNCGKKSPAEKLPTKNAPLGKLCPRKKAPSKNVEMLKLLFQSFSSDDKANGRENTWE